MKIFDIDPDQTEEIFKSLIKQIQQSNSTIVESLHQHKDGSTFPVEINIAVVKLGKMYSIAIVRNITEKKIAENKLKRSEELLKQAQQVGHIGNWELDLVENINTMSDEMYKIFDLNRSIDVTIETFLETPIPEDRRMVRELVMKSMKTREPVAFDFRTITSNGEIRWIHERSKVEVDDKGNPKRIFGTCQDITERKLAEVVLSESEKRTKALLDANPDMIFRINRAGTYLDYKADSTELYAQSEASIIGKKNRDITPPEFADLVDRYIKLTLDSGELQEFEYQMIIPNSGVRNYEARMVASGTDEVITVVRDITERKLAELKLKESGARLTDAMKIAKLSTWEYDCVLDRFTFTDQSFSLFDTTAEHEGGYTMSSGHFAQKYIYPDDRIMIEKEIRKALETPDPAYTSLMEYRVIYSPGEIGYFAANVRIEKDADNRTIKALGVNQDITERKQAEEEIKHQNALLVKLNADKDRFISILGHDLKSPFNNILGFSEILTEDIGKLNNQEIQDISKNINKSAQITNKLLEDILMWARTQQGKIPFKPQILNFRDICIDIFEILNPNAIAKNITINYSASEQITVFADIDMLKTVIRNLVSNAIKFTNSGGIIIINARKILEMQRSRFQTMALELLLMI